MAKAFTLWTKENKVMYQTNKEKTMVLLKRNPFGELHEELAEVDGKLYLLEVSKLKMEGCTDIYTRKSGVVDWEVQYSPAVHKDNFLEIKLSLVHVLDGFESGDYSPDDVFVRYLFIGFQELISLFNHAEQHLINGHNTALDSFFS